MKDPIHHAETKFGFEFGAAKIERAIAHKGHVVIDVGTPRQRVAIHVTPTGLIRIGEIGPNWDQDMTARRKKR